MSVIALSQRVEVSPHGEQRECLDRRWYSWLGSLGLKILAIPNCPELVSDYLDDFGVASIVLTGGNDLGESQARDKTETELIEEALARNIPLLGVCRGFQMLNHFFGGQLSPCEDHVRTRHRLNGWAPEVSVNSYHNFAIETQDLGESLRALSQAEDGTIEAACLPGKGLAGVMWHPEREESLRGDWRQWILKGLPCEHLS